MGKFTIISAALLAVGVVIIYQVSLGDTEFNETLPDTYWGPKLTENEEEDKRIVPFKINIDEKVLTELKRKLKDELTSDRITPPLEGIAFEYGFNSEYLKEVGDYWLNKYDWRSREKLLNQYPSFKTKINGLNIHFQHVKSKNNNKYKKTLPILVLHGWPGSFVEHQKVIPLLTDPKDSDTNFEVVVPSMPGYGFSDAARKQGLGPVEVGQLMVKLMKKLGHDKFLFQGGDWGAIIGSFLAATNPQNLLGFHSNMCMSNHPKAFIRLLKTGLFRSYFMSEVESKRFPSFLDSLSFMVRETGYCHIQGTKPDTIGAGLSQSPIGLAAYILEKFSSWTNGNGVSKADGGLTNKFTMDELLDNIMIYWVTNSITTSVRLYKEFFGSEVIPKLSRVPVVVPTACYVPRYEDWLMQTENMVAATFKNIVSFNYADDGGHFFAMEHPNEQAHDIFAFVKQLENKQN